MKNRFALIRPAKDSHLHPEGECIKLWPDSELPSPPGRGCIELALAGEGWENHSSDPEGVAIFQREVSLALLHRDPKKYAVIDKAIEQVKAKGVSYVLCKVSTEARKFMRLARAVGAEKYRATAFIRLQPIDQHRVLYGEFQIEHQTAELIMLHFMKRFPRYNIMIVFGNEVYIGRDKEIFKQSINKQKIELPKVKDDFERYWLAFYRSQYIPERRNVKYLKRMIPQKYWRWVTELQEFDQEIGRGRDRG